MESWWLLCVCPQVNSMVFFLSYIGLFIPGKKSATELADGLQNPFLLSEENDTCAYEIMVRFLGSFEF